MSVGKEEIKIRNKFKKPSATFYLHFFAYIIGQTAVIPPQYLQGDEVKQQNEVGSDISNMSVNLFK